MTNFVGSKPVAHPNDYRPDPTGGRGGADRIRSDHNGRNGNGGLQRNPSGATNPVVASNSPAHLSSVNIQQPSSAGMIMPTTRSIRGQIVVALYTYQGSEFGDMSFKKGDMMEIVDDT